MKATSNPARFPWPVPRPIRRVFTLAILAALSAAAAQPARPVTQADLEAVYLYNFGKFVTWPSEPNAAPAPFVICTLGTEEFRGALDALTSNETLQGRKIAVKHLASIAGADGCHILFLAQSEEPHLAKDLNSIRSKPILTVSSVPDFLDHGGMVQFVVQDKRVRFAVNLQPALQARLAVSSELLKVAISVHGNPAEEAR
jgi:hypothetical protein